MKIKLNSHFIISGSVSVETDEINQNRSCSSFLMHTDLVTMASAGTFAFLGWHLKLVKKSDFKKIS